MNLLIQLGGNQNAFLYYVQRIQHRKNISQKDLLTYFITDMSFTRNQKEKNCLILGLFTIQTFSPMQTDLAKKKNYTPLIIILSIAILLLVSLAYFLPELEFLKKKDLSVLPMINAVLNSITFIELSIALVAIKRKNIVLHRRMIYTALTTTGLFLVTYLVYHFGAPSTKYGGTGPLKAIYLFILLTHIVLAAAIVPLALISVARGLNMQVEKHRKIARWTMPIWLYVSITGVIVYIMIAPYYK